MNLKQHIPIFISSTYTDLIPYRKAVWDRLDKLKMAVNGMEIFGARTAEPLETCVQEVKKSQIFVAVLAMRFGSVVSETGKSFVQVEYETAIECRIDTLIYLIDEENAVLSPRFVDIGETAQKMKEFKELLRKHHTVDVFISPEDLATKIERDLLRLFKERQLSVDDNKLQAEGKSDETIELLNKFYLLPDRYKGREVELIIKFSGTPSSVSEARCQALELPIGHSLSREITVVEPPEAKLPWFVKEIFAAYDRCDFLYNSPNEKEFKVICKLAFGIESTFVNPSGVLLLMLETKEIKKGVSALIFVKTA